VGPITGVLAPYGYPAAYDTLLRGWRHHRVGPVLATPYLEYNAIYRSNIFQTTTDKRSDFVNAVFPGLRLELPVAGRTRMSVGYLGNYFMYSRNSSESHYDHNVNADVAVNFRGGLSLRLGNTFRAATEERSAATGRQRDYERLSPYFLATYVFADRWKLQGAYQFDNLEFAELQDRRNIPGSHRRPHPLLPLLAQDRGPGAIHHHFPGISLRAGGEQPEPLAHDRPDLGPHRQTHGHGEVRLHPEKLRPGAAGPG
jgi:hypothetical protein